MFEIFIFNLHTQNIFSCLACSCLLLRCPRFPMCFFHSQDNQYAVAADYASKMAAISQVTHWFEAVGMAHAQLVGGLVAINFIFPLILGC